MPLKPWCGCLYRQTISPEAGYIHHRKSAVETNAFKGLFQFQHVFCESKRRIVLHSEDEELIQNVTDFIKNNIDDELLSPSAIAEFVGVSKAYLVSEVQRNNRQDSGVNLYEVLDWNMQPSW